MPADIRLPAAESWDAVYYPNPIPLSSRCMLASALLFDRLHIPGVSLPKMEMSVTEAAEWKEEQLRSRRAERQAQRNLILWMLERHHLADIIHYPDQGALPNLKDPVLHANVHRLLDDTYGKGTAEKGMLLSEN